MKNRVRHSPCRSLKNDSIQRIQLEPRPRCLKKPMPFLPLYQEPQLRRDAACRLFSKIPQHPPTHSPAWQRNPARLSRNTPTSSISDPTPSPARARPRRKTCLTPLSRRHDPSGSFCFLLRYTAARESFLPRARACLRLTARGRSLKLHNTRYTYTYTACS